MDTSLPEQKPPEHSGASKRKLRTRGALQLLRRRRGRLLLAFVTMLLLFAGVAVTQHWFVHAQLYKTTKQELGAWAGEVADEIAFKDKWDLQGYRRASITVPIWFVVTKDGLIVDSEGFIPGLFGHVELPDDSIYTAPQTVTSAIGEKWRIFGRKVTGGSIIVGTSSPQNDRDIDIKLASNAVKFGSSLAGAESTSSRAIDLDLDYAVISSSGELKVDSGGLPLKTDALAVPTAPGHLVSFASGGRPYLLFLQPILDDRGAGSRLRHYSQGHDLGKKCAGGPRSVQSLGGWVCDRHRLRVRCLAGCSGTKPVRILGNRKQV
jgi:hypothetical protein